jgi:hypothetical protein
LYRFGVGAAKELLPTILRQRIYFCDCCFGVRICPVDNSRKSAHYQRWRVEYPENVSFAHSGLPACLFKTIQRELSISMTSAPLTGNKGTRVSLSPEIIKADNSNVESTEQQQQEGVSVPSSPRDALQLMAISTAELSRAEGDSLQKQQQHPVTEVDPLFVLPKCEPPTNVEPVEIFVAAAVQEHNSNETQFSIRYNSIVEAFRFKKDRDMMRKLLIALRTSALSMLACSGNQKHAKLIHLIVRLNPFPVVTEKEQIETAATTTCREDYHLADAHLHLITALVSANSLFLVPAMTALWKLLTQQMHEAPFQLYVKLLSAIGSSRMLSIF